MIRRRSLRRILTMAVSALIATGCAVPDRGAVQVVDPDQIPYDLNATSTSTTSSTTSPPTNPTDGSTVAPETTIPVESVNLFYVAGLQVVPIARLLLSPASAAQVLAALAEGVPPGDPAAGLRTALPADFVAAVVV
ncbi:MAG: hypothetical protein ACKOYO_02970, partial [Actinomycetota bacterium]